MNFCAPSVFAVVSRHFSGVRAELLMFVQHTERSSDNSSDAYAPATRSGGQSDSSPRVLRDARRFTEATRDASRKLSHARQQRIIRATLRRARAARVAAHATERASDTPRRAQRHENRTQRTHSRRSALATLRVAHSVTKISLSVMPGLPGPDSRSA